MIEKKVKWTLESLANVKKVKNLSEIKDELKGRQIVIFPDADEDIGASGIDGGTIYSNNKFPMIGESGIVFSIGENTNVTTITIKTTRGKNIAIEKDIVIKNTDMVFIIEEDSAEKGRWLKPEYAWRPE